MKGSPLQGLIVMDNSTDQDLEEATEEILASMQLLIRKLILGRLTGAAGLQIALISRAANGKVAVAILDSREAKKGTGEFALLPTHLMVANARATALQIKAYASSTGMEAWVSVGPFTPETRKQLPANMEAWPEDKRKEVGQVMVETRAGNRIFQAEMTRDDDGVQLGEWEELKMDGATGRCITILPENNPNMN